MCEQILLLFTEAFSLQAFLRDRRSCNSPNCRLLLLELRLYYKNSKKGSEIKRGTLYISLILLYHTRIRLFSTRQITETGYFYVFSQVYYKPVRIFIPITSTPIGRFLQVIYFIGSKVAPTCAFTIGIFNLPMLTGKRLAIFIQQIELGYGSIVFPSCALNASRQK